MTEEEKKLQPATVQDGNSGEKAQSDTTTKPVAAPKNPAPTFADSYGGQIKAQYDAIVNRKPFSYNAGEDPLYQQYVDKYVQGGRLAMMDSMGQAAALTGGYGSSYGQAVGQQQYNEYMRSLSDALPELYGMAYSQYQDEGDRMMQEYGMLEDLQADEYAKYRDAYSDWLYDEEVQYDRQQDAYGNLQNLIAATGMVPTEEQLAASGMSPEEAKALRLAWAQSDPDLALRGGYISEEDYMMLTGKDPNKKSGGGGYSAGPDARIKEMQKAMNADGYSVDVDGYTGPQTEGALAQWQNTASGQAWLINHGYL